MDKQTIIFRADGSSTIGMGHFIRTLALAEMLNENFRCIFATKNPTPYQLCEIGKVCNDYINLPDDNSHFSIFLSCLNGSEIVVLDNYYFDTEYQKAVKSIGCKLVCIDDLHDKHFVADAVINHAEGINPTVYSKEDYTQLLLGYRFALLRNEFINQDSCSTLSKEFSCLVIIGGADPFNISSKIVALLEDFKFELPIAVVVGAAFDKEHLLEQHLNVKVFKGMTSTYILQLMRQSEFGIFPASTVAIEACAARLPFICGYFIDNQKEIYLGIKKNMLAICIGDLQNVETITFCKALTQIRNNEVTYKIKQRQAERLDKQSKERYLNLFASL
jgi:UDP-2,4-diacetamido-2,4,6-trideoxy-beta-L-altropyranose hydrolase